MVPLSKLWISGPQVWSSGVGQGSNNYIGYGCVIFFLYLRYFQLCHRMLWYKFLSIFLEVRKFIGFRNLKNDFISPIIRMHMNIHCKSYTAVTQVTNKAHGPLVIQMFTFFSYDHAPTIWSPHNTKIIISYSFIWSMNKVTTRPYLVLSLRPVKSTLLASEHC